MVMFAVEINGFFLTGCAGVETGSAREGVCKPGAL